MLILWVRKQFQGLESRIAHQTYLRHATPYLHGYQLNLRAITAASTADTMPFLILSVIQAAAPLLPIVLGEVLHARRVACVLTRFRFLALLTVTVMSEVGRCGFVGAAVDMLLID